MNPTKMWDPKILPCQILEISSKFVSDVFTKSAICYNHSLTIDGILTPKYYVQYFLQIDSQKGNCVRLHFCFLEVKAWFALFFLGLKHGFQNFSWGQNMVLQCFSWSQSIVCNMFLLGSKLGLRYFSLGESSSFKTCFTNFHLGSKYGLQCFSRGPSMFGP